MQLSEAIRLGAMTTPQGHGNASYFSDEARCALGSAAHALGLQLADGLGPLYNLLITVYPWMKQGLFPCSECGHLDVAISIIWHLNDSHRWTREQIADWVESVEPKEEQEVLCAAPEEKAAELTAK